MKRERFRLRQEVTERLSRGVIHLGNCMTSLIDIEVKQPCIPNIYPKDNSLNQTQRMKQTFIKDCVLESIILSL